MAAYLRSNVCGLCRSFQFQKFAPAILVGAQTVFCNQSVRWMGFNKHWDPKWRSLRGKKVQKIYLPDYDEMRRDAATSPEEMRAFRKRKGIEPPRSFQEKSLILASTGTVFEPYVPPEGDGVASTLSSKGAKQRMTSLEMKGKSLFHVRKIRKYDEDFDTKEFADFALDIYKETHNLLQNISDNKERLHELVTEKAYPEMVWKLEKKSFRWKYIAAIEPPRVAHIRTSELMNKDNIYGQVTVRFHSQQTLAIYDRFGRLMYGSEDLVKDSLEYVVFEKYLSEEFGTWRIHGKLIPKWMPKGESQLKTFRVPNIDKELEDVEEGEENPKESPEFETTGTAMA